MGRRAVDSRPGGPTPATAARRAGPLDRGSDTHHVITGLVPVIPIRMALRFPTRDGRHKAGHDEEGLTPSCHPRRAAGEGRGSTLTR